MKFNFKKAISRLSAIGLAVLLMVPAFPIQASALSYSGSSSYMSGKYYTALKQVSLTGNQRADIVNVARSQIGYQESSSYSKLAGTVYGNGNCTEYGNWYGMQDQWCAMFVSWCANVAKISTSVVPSHAYTPTGVQWFINRGRAYSRASVANGKYTPRAGDIIYFKSPSSSAIVNHIGIVTSYSNGTVYTIEGNTSSATVSTNGGAVCAKSYSIYNTYVAYICNPNYSGSSIPASTTSSSAGNVSSLFKKATFNAKFYSDKYSDLKAAFGTDATKLYDHYLQYGIKEGRQASAIFDVKYYLENNADLKAAFGKDYKKAYDHFIEFGYKEARKTAPVVNLGTNFYAEIGSVKAKLNVSINSGNGDVLTYTDTSSAYQTWKFVRQSNGSYEIVNQATGKLLSVPGGTYSNNLGTQVADDKDANYQRWFLHEAKSGQYYLRSAGNSCYMLYVKDDATAINTPLVVYHGAHATAQRFTVNKVEVSVIEPPVISNVKVTDVSSSGYTVSCTATSSIGISRVAFSSWSHANDRDDVVWGNGTKNGNTYTFRVNTSDHNNDTGAYGTRIFAYDTNGEKTKFVVADTTVPTKDSVITPSSLIKKAVFNAKFYSDKYSDLKAAFGTDAALLYDHYLQYGIKEGRQASAIFDVKYYLENNADLKAAFGSNYVAAFNHFVEIGYKEARKTTTPVNVGTNFYAEIGSVKASLNVSINSENGDVLTYNDTSSDYQTWKFVRQADGSYEIINKATGKALSATGGAYGNNLNTRVEARNGAAYQRWFLHEAKSGQYYLRSAGNACYLLYVKDDSTAPNTHLVIYHGAHATAQRFTINKVGDAPADTAPIPTQPAQSGTSANKMEVIRKIIYAVETGGQVYGKADYTSFVEAYTNSDIEHAITIGAGQWYATEAKTLLNLIRKTDPALFASLDTAGIAYDLDNKDWSTYKLSKSSAKAKCIQAIIGSSVGRACQDQLIDEQMKKYMKEAADLGVTDLAAQMMCANIRHQGGLGALKRVLAKTAAPYTLDNIYAAMQSDTGNQVGAYKQRQKMVYEALKKYL